MLEVRGDEAQRLLLTRAGVGVDLGQPEYEHSAAHDFELVDLRSEACLALTCEVRQIHHVPADTGGNGSVTTECAKSARDNRTVPQGVRNYSTDDTLMRHVVGWWPPRVLLAEGPARTCTSIAQQRAPHRARIGLRAAALGPRAGAFERIITAV